MSNPRESRIAFASRTCAATIACNGVLLSASALIAIAQPRPQPKEWHLSPKPSLTIGAEGDPQKEFLRINGLARSTDGSIVVSNGGSTEIRVFDPSGKYLRTFGRKGSGPGEFRDMNFVARGGDTLFMYDFGQQRLSKFSMRSGYVSGQRFPSLVPDATTYPISRFQSGGYVTLPVRPTSMRHPDGTFRDSVRVGIVPESLADSIFWIGTFPYATHLAYNPTNGERAMTVGFYPFAPGFQWTVAGDAIWIGDTGNPELQVFDRTGKLLFKPRVPWEVRPFDAVAIAQSKERALSAVTGEIAIKSVSARYDAKYRPRNEPLFGRLLVSLDGNVWVERFRLDPFAAAEYAVMNARGQVVARATTPAGLNVLEIGKDYVLGVTKDDDGVESVAMFRLNK